MTDKLPKISAKEKEVMSVLWQSETSLTATGIVGVEPELNINTVQTALRSLLKKKFVEIADIVYSGTVLTRTFKPVVSAEEYLTDQMFLLTEKKTTSPILNFIEYLLTKADNSTLDQLEAKIKESRKG